MAILTPDRAFEGATASNNKLIRIIKQDSGIRVVDFKNDMTGQYFFILPPYKLDREGRGVSWKVVQVRDHFGVDDYGEQFAVPDNCPVAYFAGQAKRLFPAYVKVEQQMQNNKNMKVFPPTGRVTNKVLFNVAYYSNLSLGAHVLVLPQYGAAASIQDWANGKRPNGELNPLLNDPKAAIPVFVQLKKGAIGNPWVVTPDGSQAFQLPAELSDTDYLYNLDEVLHYPSKEELIDKMRTFVPADIFDACMAGYDLGGGRYMGGKAATVAPAMGAPAVSQAPVTRPAPSQPVPTQAPQSVAMPKAGIAQVQQAASASLPQPTLATQPPNPSQPAPLQPTMPTPAKPMTVEEATAYLSAKKAEPAPANGGPDLPRALQ